MKIVLDMDTGVDDAVAMVLALNSPEVEVLAVTAVAGNARLEECERNSRLLAGLLAPERTPRIASGAAVPMIRPLLTAPEVHGADGLGGETGSLPEPSVKLEPVPAAELLAAIPRETAEPVSLIATGPLTNVALALEADREGIARYDRIIVMGGAFAVPGNTGPVAEFNFYVDPEAARIVMRSGLDVTVVPLDATTRVTFMRDDIAARPRTPELSPTPPADVPALIWRALNYYIDYQVSESGVEGGYMHDPLAVAALIDPGLVSTTDGLVDVCLSGPDRGRSALRAPGDDDPSVRVAFNVDESRFRALLDERVLTPLFGPSGR